MAHQWWNNSHALIERRRVETTASAIFFLAAHKQFGLNLVETEVIIYCSTTASASRSLTVATWKPHQEADLWLTINNCVKDPAFRQLIARAVWWTPFVVGRQLEVVVKVSVDRRRCSDQLHAGNVLCSARSMINCGSVRLLDSVLLLNDGSHKSPNYGRRVDYTCRYQRVLMSLPPTRGRLCHWETMKAFITGCLLLGYCRLHTLSVGSWVSSLGL